MKQISFAAFLLCSALVPVRADLPRPLPFPHPPSRPKPSQLVVSNLSAFPKVKFTIRVGDLPPEPIEEDRTYEFKAATRLFAADAGHKRREWATVEYDGSNAERVQIVVKKVSYSKAGIEVDYDIDKTPWHSPWHKQPPPTTSAAWPAFVLSGLGCCGLVLLAPRARRPAAPANHSQSP